jgi:imidazolonepropionase-like amidohydrolase
MTPLATRLGVVLLASTDNVGSVADDVATLVRYGVDPEIALRAATTGARRFLGAPGLDEGAPADIVTFELDPREDPSVLREPTAILLAGDRIR